MHPVTNIIGVEKNRCKYGFPRAFMQYPVNVGIQSGGNFYAQQFSSGMVRLSCPHLVKAVDAFEMDEDKRVGAIKVFNAKLTSDSNDGADLRSNFLQTNTAWKEIRQDAVSVDDVALMNKVLGEKGATNLLYSGIIGITANKVDDVKCLHAHISDYLLRGSNEIGKQALMQLDQAGVDTAGCNGIYCIHLY